MTYAEQPGEALDALAEAHPRFTCFVAPHAEAGRDFVAAVHELTRRYDADPYTDTLWGILTGYDAANALAIAEEAEPLTVRKVGSGTELAMECVEEGTWYCELKQGKMVAKRPGEAAQVGEAPPDTTASLAALLNDYHADLFVTSGHATERDWQIGYTYKNGYFRCKDGELFGIDTGGHKHPIRSDNPKVYMPIGNCLMGHIDSDKAMALAFMNSAGVRQMLGYTVPTWFGYGGWGVLDYFVEQPGRYTFAEAFFANQHALIHRLNAIPEGADAQRAAGFTPMDAKGLEFDKNVVAFYGDPGWVARMAPGKLAYGQTLAQSATEIVFEIKPLLGDKSFDPVNTNGAQRGFRPMVAFLENRIDPAKVTIAEGADLNPVVADDFLLIPHPGKCDPERAYRVRLELAE
ncbi:MAG: hypothetical protein R3F11_01320 [Verrucomicrobiales bacterium]